MSFRLLLSSLVVLVLPLVDRKLGLSEGMSLAQRHTVKQCLKQSVTKALASFAAYSMQREHTYCPQTQNEFFIARSNSTPDLFWPQAPTFYSSLTS